MQPSCDVLVVGAGILGCAHAYQALTAGYSVMMIERDKEPQGASVRNFGQIVPSGMDRKWQRIGRESLRIYKDLQAMGDIAVASHGSLYVATSEGELQLLEELRAINLAEDYPSELLTTAQCLARQPLLNPERVRGGLFYHQDMVAEPRHTVNRIRQLLIERFSLRFQSGTAITSIEEEGNRVIARTAAEQEILAGKVIVCSGAVVDILYPEVFKASSMQIVKLQMLATKPQPEGTNLQGSILTGRTIKRYEAFQECPSYDQVKEAELAADDYGLINGVHILYKMGEDRRVILGDSHHYFSVKSSEPVNFDQDDELDSFMIGEAKELVSLPDYGISHRWQGFYSQMTDTDIFAPQVSTNVHIVTGIGGKGMTGSLGFAKGHFRTIMES